MVAAFDRIREQMFSSTPDRATPRQASTAHEQRAKHAASRSATRRATDPQESELLQTASNPLGEFRRAARNTDGEILPCVTLRQRSNSAVSACKSSSAQSREHIDSTSLLIPQPAAQITDSDQESATSCESACCSFEGEGDACVSPCTETQTDLNMQQIQQQKTTATSCLEQPHQLVCDQPFASDSDSDPCCGPVKPASESESCSAESPTSSRAAGWPGTFRSVCLVLVSLALLELGVTAMRSSSLLRSFASAGIPAVTAHLFQRSADTARILMPRHPLAVQLPEDISEPVEPQTPANQMRMKLVKGGTADEYRVLLDVSTIQSMLVRRGQAQLCLTVHKQQVGPAPPPGSRGGAGRPPPPSRRGRRNAMAHLPFAQACADSSSTAALLDWQHSYSAQLAGRTMPFADAFTALRGADLWREFVDGERSSMDVPVIQLHFLLSGLRPGTYRVSALLPTAAGRKLTTQTLLRVSRPDPVQAPASAFTDEFGVANVVAGGGVHMAGSPRQLGAALSVTPLYDSGVFDIE